MTKCNRCGKENPAEIHTCTPPLALRLADALDAECAAREEIFRTRYKEFREAATELRRLHDENEALRAERTKLLSALTKARAGLSNGLWDYGPGQDEHAQCDALITDLDAAIEAAHGIKGEQT